MKTNIKLSNINFSYVEGTRIINDFSLEINEGDIIGIKGPSGSGKTTLFRLLLGFETPDSGTISFNGIALDPEHLNLFRKQTTWLPQDLDLGEGKVKDLFYYPFTFKTNRSNKPKEHEILSTFDTLGLDKNVWESNFRTLSTGQRQRVGVALIHLLDKTVLFLDEPTSALDELAKEKVKNLLFDDKRIIVSTSHDQWWLEQCSRIIELRP